VSNVSEDNNVNDDDAMDNEVDENDGKTKANWKALPPEQMLEWMHQRANMDEEDDDEDVDDSNDINDDDYLNNGKQPKKQIRSLFMKQYGPLSKSVRRRNALPDLRPVGVTSWVAGRLAQKEAA
jgi:hypothetical protein